MEETTSKLFSASLSSAKLTNAAHRAGFGHRSQIHSQFAVQTKCEHLTELDCATLVLKVCCVFSLSQEKNAQLLGTAQQLFTHCQAQKEEIKRLFQQKLDEVTVVWWQRVLVVICMQMGARKMRPCKWVGEKRAQSSVRCQSTLLFATSRGIAFTL